MVTGVIVMIGIPLRLDMDEVADPCVCPPGSAVTRLNSRSVSKGVVAIACILTRFAECYRITASIRDLRNPCGTIVAESARIQHKRV